MRHYGAPFLFNAFCFLLLFAMFTLFRVWLKQFLNGGQHKNKLGMVGWILILVLITGSMSVRKGASIYLLSDFVATKGDFFTDANKGKFYLSVLEKVGQRKTEPWGNNGTWQGYFYPSLGFILDGPFEDFYDNGKKRQEGTFHNYHPFGTYRRWYETGQIQLEAEFAEGKPNGHVYVWNEDGSKWSEGNFLKGNPSDDWLYYSAGNPEGVKGSFEFCKALHLEGRTDKRYKWLVHFFSMEVSPPGGVSLPWLRLGDNLGPDLRGEIAGLGKGKLKS